jgi:hypothetical protein
MPALKYRAHALLVGLAAGALAVAAAVVPGPASASPAAAPPGGGGTAGCVTTFEPPSTWIVICGNGTGSGGGGGGGGGGKVVCTLTLLSPGQIQFFGLPKAPPGEAWAAITCPGNSPFGGVTLVDTAAPAATPQELLQEVEGQLTVRPLAAQTAPPRGEDGLVGLAEWYWVPKADWHPIRTQRLQVGATWAQVTATPVTVGFEPGGGQAGPAGCTGPGIPFSPAVASQTSPCSYIYQASSATQQGGAYAAAVTVTWRVTWQGFSPATGLVGGVLNPALVIADQFNLKVAEGQALVSGTGVSQ